MNILHLQNYLNLSCGVSKTIYLIIKNTSTKYQHYVTCFDGDGFSRFNSINIFPNAIKDYRYSLIGYLIHIQRLYSFCKTNKIDIIHAHHRYFDLIAWLLSKIINIKTVTSVHSKVYHKTKLSYKADVIIACSDGIKKHLESYFGIDPARIKVIKNFIDVEEMAVNRNTADLMKELGIVNNSFVCGYIGRMNFKEKGVDILLNAFKEIFLVDKNCVLLLIGNGPKEREISEIIGTISINAIQISSKLDIYNYYNLMDVVILPSRIDPFPLVMLESGLVSKPLIASKIDGIEETIKDGENGLLFESENTVQLLECIIKLRNNTDLRKILSKNLCNMVLHNFTSAKMIPEYLKIYDYVNE